MSDSHAAGQHERDTPGHHPEPAPALDREEVREAPSAFAAVAAPLINAPPDGAPTRHAATIRLLPATDLRRQFAAGLVRRHGNAYLQRVLAGAPTVPVSEAPSAPVGLTHASTLAVPPTAAESDSATWEAPRADDVPAIPAASLDRLTEQQPTPPAQPAATISSDSIAEAQDADAALGPGTAPAGTAPAVVLRWAAGQPSPFEEDCNMAGPPHPRRRHGRSPAPRTPSAITRSGALGGA